LGEDSVKISDGGRGAGGIVPDGTDDGEEVGAGKALGFDRFVMLASGAADFKGVPWAPST
jgi:hypothetical protein